MRRFWIAKPHPVVGLVSRSGLYLLIKPANASYIESLSCLRLHQTLVRITSNSLTHTP